MIGPFEGALCELGQLVADISGKLYRGASMIG
jgi:hypothetical protein